jgi:hypothetical protein
VAADLIGVEQISREHAACMFQAARVTDPEGLQSAASMAEGQCVRVRAACGAAAVSYELQPGRLWCIAVAAEGQGADRVRVCDAVLSLIAKRHSLRRLGFQTGRRGLVRRCKALGYIVTGRAGRGWILEKVIA